MILNINEIQSAKHIVLVSKNSTFANASAVYSYLLTLHKKVSLYNPDMLAANLAFLPWFEKSRTTLASSADLVIKVSADSKELFEFFISQEIKINVKMATALYCGILQQYDFFKSQDCNGTIFAISSQLIALGADYQTCNEYMLHRVALSVIRLKAILFKGLLLKENASLAEVYMSDEELKK